MMDDGIGITQPDKVARIQKTDAIITLFTLMHQMLTIAAQLEKNIPVHRVGRSDKSVSDPDCVTVGSLLHQAVIFVRFNIGYRHRTDARISEFPQSLFHDLRR